MSQKSFLPKRSTKSLRVDQRLLGYLEIMHMKLYLRDLKEEIERREAAENQPAEVL